MIESGFWIFLVETLGVGLLFIALIWWIVGGATKRDRKLRDHDEAARKAAEARGEEPPASP